MNQSELNKSLRELTEWIELYNGKTYDPRCSDVIPEFCFNTADKYNAVAKMAGINEFFLNKSGPERRGTNLDAGLLYLIMKQQEQINDLKLAMENMK